MDKFIVRRSREPRPERIREKSPPKTKQVTIESLPKVVVVEDVKRLKLQLESDLSTPEDILSALQELKAKTPSKAVLLSTQIGHTINSLRKHTCQDVCQLAKEIFRKWKHFIVEEEKEKPAIDVKCDLKTETMRNKAREFLVKALQDEEGKLSEQIERTVFFNSNRKIDNFYRRKMRTIIFTLKHKEQIRTNVLNGKMKIEQLFQGLTPGIQFS
ncbi:predicted protein [Nematostella vectensis]|uniref:TFIIS N-terminal domain-containing protein n=2 Tax=Nematostella vectensis TaxID=45351 RepID=A7SU38_NEMVE|nr:predicted protein [Nematostella vectensis]|eukprot:XP_001624856.1 predicted protein [Nematostella vectensis]